jgi:hypothetical protein
MNKIANVDINKKESIFTSIITTFIILICVKFFWMDERPG